ncbi:hypothetical protein [Thiocapsa rosea]|uniref:Uncharacterized protein n=1 Tax=Thiocapsa rosea TaxID=69360 RepID=A0A495UKZ5_9GAMM|nr:hypothetical protein [Thiocapsa rosea]RKT37956.1 hypothetical protein BDD21_5468 [Thiocapsa rosea]
MNPNLGPVGRRWLHEGRHGEACARQVPPALNLYKWRDWSVDMGQVCGLSDEHSEEALSMLMDYRMQADGD